eukprot:382090_1
MKTFNNVYLTDLHDVYYLFTFRKIQNHLVILWYTQYSAQKYVKSTKHQRGLYSILYETEQKLMRGLMFNIAASTQLISNWNILANCEIIWQMFERKSEQ